jgi:hypothetical protein
MKTPEEMAEEYADSCLTTNAYILSKEGFLAGYKAAQETYEAEIRELKEELKNNVENVTLEDILGMTIEEYLHKHSEEIAEEVLNSNSLLKDLKDE